MTNTDAIEERYVAWVKARAEANRAWGAWIASVGGDPHYLSVVASVAEMAAGDALDEVDRAKRVAEAAVAQE